jgi:hypothetical protein
LNRILALRSRGVQVWISEIPTYPTYSAYFGDAQIRDKYLQDIAAIVDKGGGIFLPAVDESLIPLEGRSDNHHLNLYGAPIYSYALAQQLADLCNNQNLCLSAVQEGDQP